MRQAGRILFAIALAAVLFAKGPTRKITMAGGDLRHEVEVGDANLVAQFNIWTGPGTTSTSRWTPEENHTFIVDWSRGVAADRPEGLQRYEVSFYANHHSDGPDYIVYYEYDRSTQQGYVYFPAPGEKWYSRDTSSILRGVEGSWFHSWSAWDEVARPLMEKSHSSR